MKKLRVGIIGCGGIANGKHMPGLKANSDLCEMVWFCDIIPERAEKAAKEFGAEGAKWCEDYKQLLADPDVDLVLLDEPSEGVAPVIVEQMVNMILELKGQGVSILLSEQNMHFAELVSDRAYVLEKGQIRFTGSMAELAAAEDVRRAYLSV